MKKIESIANKFMNTKFKGDEKYFKVGVEMYGGDIEYVKNLLKLELEIINNKYIEEIIKYNPYKFNKAWKTNEFIESILEILPGG